MNLAILSSQLLDLVPEKYEEYLEIVSVILESVSFDLSSFAPELGKTFCTSLRNFRKL